MMIEGPITVMLVTDQIRCENIISMGAKVAKKAKTNPVVLTALVSNHETYNFQAIEHLFAKAKKHSAQLNTIYTDDVVASIAEYINSHNTKQVITGVPKDENSSVYKLADLCPKAEFLVCLDGARQPVLLNN